LAYLKNTGSFQCFFSEAHFFYTLKYCAGASDFWNAGRQEERCPYDGKMSAQDGHGRSFYIFNVDLIWPINVRGMFMPRKIHVLIQVGMDAAVCAPFPYEKAPKTK